MFKLLACLQPSQSHFVILIYNLTKYCILDELIRVSIHKINVYFGGTGNLQFPSIHGHLYSMIGLCYTVILQVCMNTDTQSTHICCGKWIALR